MALVPLLPLRGAPFLYEKELKVGRIFALSFTRPSWALQHEGQVPGTSKSCSEEFAGWGTSSPSTVSAVSSGFSKLTLILNFNDWNQMSYG